MVENKTQATHANVAAFIAAVEPAGRRADAEALDALLQRVTGRAPEMWGPSIIGYCRYHYRYESGHGGEMCRIGFSPRKTALVLYLASDAPARADLLARLGRHTTGKACLYVPRLGDVELAVLEELARDSWAWMNRAYPD